MTNDISPCSCPVAGYCERHKLEKSPVQHKLCQNKPKYRQAWDEGRLHGQGQPNTTEGPGTELKKLISWFVWSKSANNCSACITREQRMNRWGPDKCKENIHTIVGWLRESAAQHKYPFSEIVAAALIKQAIANSRK